MIKALSERNFLVYAAQHYTNSQCMVNQEFYDDLNRFKYIKRLFKRYRETGELKERLALNHIIVIYNVFEREAATRMLFFKLKGFYDCLVPFLVFLSYMPEQVHLSEVDTIRLTDITMDPSIVSILRKI